MSNDGSDLVRHSSIELLAVPIQRPSRIREILTNRRRGPAVPDTDCPAQPEPTSLKKKTLTRALCHHGDSSTRCTVYREREQGAAYGEREQGEERAIMS